MCTLPKRKRLRLENYNYATEGAYFITICAKNRNPLFWTTGVRRGELCSPDVYENLSETGKIVDNEIQKIEAIYENITIDKYCIMPDHIHMIIFVHPDKDGRTQFAPTVSRVIKQFKGSITKKIGISVWQKSFVDRIIRNEQGYLEAWNYIENNFYKALKCP